MENGDRLCIFYEVFFLNWVDYLFADSVLHVIIIFLLRCCYYCHNHLFLDTRRRDWGLRKRTDQDLHL